MISDKVPIHKLSHLEHRDNRLAVEYRQQLFVCADVALILWILELVFANVLPKLFGQFGPGSGSFPTTAVSAASGCTGLLRAFLGAAAFFGVGIGQLERAELGCQAKNQMCLNVVRGSAGARGISSRSAILVGVLGHLEFNNLLWGVICGFHILLTSI